jgi:shikimate kinase
MPSSSRSADAAAGDPAAPVDPATAVSPAAPPSPATAVAPSGAASPVPAFGPLVLVGMMATGKTTIGRRLAAALGRRLFDSDEMIQRRTGKTVAELWENGGEPAFRTLETEVLAEALRSDPPAVVAAAGGVVLAAANREELQRVSERGGVVVWLRADPAVLAGRVQPGDHRPLLASHPAETLRRLAAERATLYAEVADRQLDVGKLSVVEAATAILAEVAALSAERAAAAGGAAPAPAPATAARVQP